MPGIGWLISHKLWNQSASSQKNKTIKKKKSSQNGRQKIQKLSWQQAPWIRNDTNKTKKVLKESERGYGWFNSIFLEPYLEPGGTSMK